MKILLDTHTILWYLEGSNSLSIKSRNEIEKPKNEVVVSLVSFWEIAIKSSLGKINLENSIPEMIAECRKQDFKVLSIRENHIFELQNLPLHHRDPFDRLLIAQTKVENLTFISVDKNMHYYNIPLLW